MQTIRNHEKSNEIIGNHWKSWEIIVNQWKSWEISVNHWTWLRMPRGSPQTLRIYHQEAPGPVRFGFNVFRFRFRWFRPVPSRLEVMPAVKGYVSLAPTLPLIQIRNI